MFNATALYAELQGLQYPSTGGDEQHELDILGVFENHGFKVVETRSEFKTKKQKELFDHNLGNQSVIASTFPDGIHIIHHPLGKRRHPDFIAVIDGKTVVIEAKSCGSKKVPIFKFNNHLMNPQHDDCFLIFTHSVAGTELLLPRDLITVQNYLLMRKHKLERDELQAKQDAEFQEVCGGIGIQHYNRVNYITRGGKEHTDYITRSREMRLAKHVLSMLKKLEMCGNS